MNQREVQLVSIDLGRSGGTLEFTVEKGLSVTEFMALPLPVDRADESVPAPLGATILGYTVDSRSIKHDADSWCARIALGLVAKETEIASEGADGRA